MARGGQSAALLGVAALAALLFSGRARAQSAQFENPGDYDQPGDDLSPLQFYDPLAFYDQFSFDPMTPPTQSPLLPSQSENLAAFLRMIRFAEHDDGKAESGAAYFTFYGNSSFTGTNDHPVATKEKRGVKLPDQMCINAGFSPGCVSTAAGAYQIILPTWRRVRKSGEWGPYLPDFSPASQDEAARRLLIENNALWLVEAGNIPAAIKRVAPIWASLPGNTAKQGGITLAQAVAYFNDGLTNVG